jgi:hypothetical protein
MQEFEIAFTKVKRIERSCDGGFLTAVYHPIPR